MIWRRQSSKQNFKSPLLSLFHHLRSLPLWKALLDLMRGREVWLPTDFPKQEIISVTALVYSRVTLAIRVQCSLISDSRCPFQYFLTLYEHNYLFYSNNSHYIFSLFNKLTWNSYGFLISFLLMKQTPQGTKTFFKKILVLTNDGSLFCHQVALAWKGSTL